MAPNRLLAPSTSSHFIGRLEFTNATTLSSISFRVRKNAFSHECTGRICDSNKILSSGRDRGHNPRHAWI
jgi:hypothetical protein